LIEVTTSEIGKVDAVDVDALREVQPHAPEQHRQSRFAPSVKEELRHVERIDDIRWLDLIEPAPRNPRVADKHVEARPENVDVAVLHPHDPVLDRLKAAVRSWHDPPRQQTFDETGCRHDHPRRGLERLFDLFLDEEAAAKLDGVVAIREVVAEYAHVARRALRSGGCRRQQRHNHSNEHD
jgi:hypothetical protein